MAPVKVLSAHNKANWVYCHANTVTNTRCHPHRGYLRFSSGVSVSSFFIPLISHLSGSLYIVRIPHVAVIYILSNVWPSDHIKLTGVGVGISTTVSVSTSFVIATWLADTGRSASR